MISNKLLKSFLIKFRNEKALSHSTKNIKIGFDIESYLDALIFFQLKIYDKNISYSLLLKKFCYKKMN